MAAPQVAGAAALLLAAYAAGGANVTGRGLELKALLLATVQPVSGMAHKVSKHFMLITMLTGRWLLSMEALLSGAMAWLNAAHDHVCAVSHCGRYDFADISV